MCGICGIVLTGADEPVGLDVLRRMNQALHHRGPDDSGEYVEPGAALAMRRLAIVDLAAGQQPMFNEDRTIVVVCNGEIYNHRDVRARLLQRGHVLHTNSDIEVIAHAYEEFGDEFPQVLNGMFAIALWDRPRRRLLLVRDRLGIKPLYFARVGNGLAFSSELRSLIEHPAIERRLNLRAFSEYLTFQHTIPPATILQDVQKLPAGNVAVFENGALSLRAYWDVRFANDAEDMGESAYVDGFRQLFTKSVERQLMSDVPLGVFLSGGIDSSAIVATMAQLGVQGRHTYSLGYDHGDVYGELSHAALVARSFETVHDEILVSSSTYRDALPRFIEHIDEPVSDSAGLLFLLLAQRARQDVTVVLCGQGADETLGGYELFNFQQRFDRIRRFQRLPRWLRVTLPALMDPALPAPVRDWLARGNTDLSHINAQRLHTLAWQFETADKRRLCPVLRDVDDHCADIIRGYYQQSGAQDPLHQILYVYSKVALPENLLMHGDKMTMACSVELRVPFLDHELVEFAARVPSKYLIRREPDGSYTTKSLLKRAMRGMVPDVVLQRPKVAFPIPLTEWLQTALAEDNRQVLLSTEARASGIYDMPALEQLLNQHGASPTRETTLQIKNLLFFEMWRQRMRVT